MPSNLDKVEIFSLFFISTPVFEVNIHAAGTFRSRRMVGYCMFSLHLECASAEIRESITHLQDRDVVSAFLIRGTHPCVKCRMVGHVMFG